MTDRRRYESLDNIRPGSRPDLEPTPFVEGEMMPSENAQRPTASPRTRNAQPVEQAPVPAKKSPLKKAFTAVALGLVGFTGFALWQGIRTDNTRPATAPRVPEAIIIQPDEAAARLAKLGAIIDRAFFIKKTNGTVTRGEAYPAMEQLARHAGNLPAYTKFVTTIEADPVFGNTPHAPITLNDAARFDELFRGYVQTVGTDPNFMNIAKLTANQAFSQVIEGWPQHFTAEVIALQGLRKVVPSNPLAVEKNFQSQVLANLITEQDFTLMSAFSKAYEAQFPGRGHGAQGVAAIRQGMNTLFDGSTTQESVAHRTYLLAKEIRDLLRGMNKEPQLDKAIDALKQQGFQNPSSTLMNLQMRANMTCAMQYEAAKTLIRGPSACG